MEGPRTVKRASRAVTAEPGEDSARAMESVRRGPKELAELDNPGASRRAAAAERQDRTEPRTDPEPPVTSDLRIRFLGTDACAISLKLSPRLQPLRKLRAQAPGAGRRAVPVTRALSRLATSRGLLCLGQSPVTYSSPELAETEPKTAKFLEAPRALQTQPTKIKTPSFYRRDLVGRGQGLRPQPRQPQMVNGCRATNRSLLKGAGATSLRAPSRLARARTCWAPTLGLQVLGTSGSRNEGYKGR